MFLDEQEVELADVIQRPLPPCPLESTFLLHWLAVDGLQPETPQNPPPQVARKASDTLDAGDEHQVRELVRHKLSHEMQLYFQKVTAAIKSCNEAQQQHAFASLAQEPGLQELMPYFSQFVSQQVTQNLKNLPLLMSLMKTLRCLLTNPYVHVELYVSAGAWWVPYRYNHRRRRRRRRRRLDVSVLRPPLKLRTPPPPPPPQLHELLPAVLTCVVGKRLCAKPVEDHWALRDVAAQIITWVCKRYASRSLRS